MREANQLSLFPDVTGESLRLSGIDWSYSRRTTLERCARQYYYHYYAASTRLAKNDQQKQEIAKLKGLSNCHLRSGWLVHQAIRLFYSKGEASREWLVDWARGIYRQDLESSRAAGYASLETSSEGSVTLLEFYYGWPDAEAVYARSEEGLCNMIESFLTSPAYDEPRFAGQRPSSHVEKSVILETPLFKARGKVDLAFSQEGTLVIVDWKTGQTSLPVESLQLSFYGLWAVETGGRTVDEVAVYYGQLADGTLQPMSLDERTLQRGRARIAQDLERMDILDAYGRDAVADAFPTCGFPRVCKLCQYQGICDNSSESRWEAQ